jgi:hypothetical protein
MRDVAAREVAAELIRWVDLCRAHGVTDCAECCLADAED